MRASTRARRRTPTVRVNETLPCCRAWWAVASLPLVATRNRAAVATTRPPAAAQNHQRSSGLGSFSSSGAIGTGWGRGIVCSRGARGGASSKARPCARAREGGGSDGAGRGGGDPRGRRAGVAASAGLAARLPISRAARHRAGITGAPTCPCTASSGRRTAGGFPTGAPRWPTPGSRSCVSPSKDTLTGLSVMLPSPPTARYTPSHSLFAFFDMLNTRRPVSMPVAPRSFGPGLRQTADDGVSPLEELHHAAVQLAAGGQQLVAGALQGDRLTGLGAGGAARGGAAGERARKRTEHDQAGNSAGQSVDRGQEGSGRSGDHDVPPTPVGATRSSQAPGARCSRSSVPASEASGILITCMAAAAGARARC